MSAIANIRQSLRDASYLAWSPVPFAGAVHNFARPLRQRFEQRQYTGPYYFSPAKPGTARGFYQAHNLACGDGPFDLRLENANDHLCGSRLGQINGYYCDPDCDGDTLQPIVARLPHGRGFLAGWTMGPNMAASIDSGTIWETAQDAARAAHDMAASDAEKSCERNPDDDCDE